MDKLQMAAQLRRVLQMFASGLPETAALEVAAVYPAYAVGRSYRQGEYITCGVDGNGDPCLYRVAQSHTSQEDWPPESNPALYTRIGLDSQGVPVWSQPAGAHDAYNIGDIVDYQGTLYRSVVDGNVWSPEEYPQGWKIVSETNV